MVGHVAALCMQRVLATPSAQSSASADLGAFPRSLPFLHICWKFVWEYVSEIFFQDPIQLILHGPAISREARSCEVAT